MNTVVLIGRLTRDPELKYIASTGMAVTRFAIAVNRPFAKKDAEVTVDFFNITVFGKRAETSANYLKKGLQVAIQGRIQNDNYTDSNGVKHYSTSVIADNVEFIDWGDKKSQGSGFAPSNNSGSFSSNQASNEFMPEGLDEEGYRALSDDDVPF